MVFRWIASACSAAARASASRPRSRRAMASIQLEDGLVVRGEVLKCVPRSELVFTWVVDEFLNTRVSYRLEPDGTGTRVLFEHSGFEQEGALTGAEYGWNVMHGTLAKASRSKGALDEHPLVGP